MHITELLIMNMYGVKSNLSVSHTHTYTHTSIFELCILCVDNTKAELWNKECIHLCHKHTLGPEASCCGVCPVPSSTCSQRQTY